MGLQVCGLSGAVSAHRTRVEPVQPEKQVVLSDASCLQAAGTGTGVGGPWALPESKGGLIPQPELPAAVSPKSWAGGVGMRGGTGWR